MKKIIALILSVLLVFCCLSFSVSADNSSITISDDYSDIYLNGKRYTRFNASAIQYELTETISDNITLSTTQEILISDIYLAKDANGVIVHAKFSHYDGSTLTADYLNSDYIEIYNDIMTSDKGTYVIDFEYPEGNTVNVDKSALKGEYINLFPDEIYISDYFEVTAQNSDGTIVIIKGCLIVSDDEYYYIDYEEAGITNIDEFYPYVYSSALLAHKITDTDLIAGLDKAMEEYYSDDLGFLLDDSFSESVSSVFLVFVFAVIPFAVLVLFLILAIRSKTVYKKLFGIICVLSAAELAVFTILACLIKFYS